MRAKHHYTIIKATYEYGDWFEDGIKSKKEKIVFTTNKKELADRYMAEHAYEYEDNGTIYKGVYYPNVELTLRKDY